jgi:chromosome segregation ATPase
MSLFERLGELTKSLLNINLELQHIREQQAQDRQAARDTDADLRRLSREIQATNEQILREVRSLSERIARLEASRDADRAELRAKWRGLCWRRNGRHFGQASRSRCRRRQPKRTKEMDEPCF